MQSSFGPSVLNSSHIDKSSSLKSLFSEDLSTTYSKALGKSIEDISTTIYRCDKNKVGTYEYRLIFWGLVILALDKELYKKYLVYVVNVA